MPNRIIKESIRTSKQIGLIDDFTFRVWAYLITYVDDYGRGSADPEILKGFLFPRRKGTTEKNIADALDKLACAGLIVLYKVDGDSFLYFPTWSEHQRIRTKRSRFPAPAVNTENIEITNLVSNSPQIAADCRRLPPESESESNPNIESEYILSSREKREHANRFTPPTVEDVRTYCEERKNGIEAERFIDYYSSIGWKVGNKPMKDWKACIRNWERREIKSNPKESSFDTDDFFEAALAKTYGEERT